jgi:hypothetical protein
MAARQAPRRRDADRRGWFAVTPRRLSELEKGERRRAWLRTGAVLTLARVVLIVIPSFLVVFATVYLSLSNASAVTFSEQLDHTRALYFAFTVFSTVGFGRPALPGRTTPRLGL